MGACPSALKWLENYASLDGAWQVCERGDWMLWLLGKWSGLPESESRKKLVLLCCQCARLALPYVAKGNFRPFMAMGTAKAWAKGKNNITLQDVRIAAADAAGVDGAAIAARAAAHVAYAGDASVAAAAAAGAAADAAGAAAEMRRYGSQAADAKATVLKKCADIVRNKTPHVLTMKGR